MRKMMMLLVLTVVMGLTAVNSASAGFVGTGSTKVELVKIGYAETGLVNKFNQFNQLITTNTSFAGAANESLYSQALTSGGKPMNVYLVSSPALAFGATATDGEKIVGVAASNGFGGLTANVVGSHIGLQAQIKTAMEAMFGPSATVNTAASAFFSTGTQALEIHNSAAPDSMIQTDYALSGSVNAPSLNGVNGINEMFLVFTVVPEPTSLGLFGIGALVVGLARSRRKKS
ncbi:MAG: PEP-CTERM sorting domain-containing protein [Planctomycetota bacterium]|nr:PEP-CTERM sorting domain-containing protein [Planctomycetota bacterium]